METPLQQQGNTQPSTPLMLFLVSLEQLGVFWNLLCVLRPCLGCLALNWPLWPNQGSENRTEGEADVGNEDSEMEQEQAGGTGEESREFSHNQLVRVSQIRYFTSCRPSYCSGPLFFSYHFILQPHTLQSLTNTLKIKNPCHSKFYPRKSLEHESTEKCPWTSKKYTNTIYTRQFFKQKFHFPLPNVIFTAALRDE